MKINGEDIGEGKEWLEALADLVRRGIFVQVEPGVFQLTAEGHALAEKQEREEKN